MYRILIIEDDFDISELLQSWLTEAGYQTAEAEDGLKALEVFESGQFDLVLVDLMLPRLDGFGVCEWIRKRSNVPIVMLTALDGEEEQLRGYDLRIDDYVTKPFSLEEVVARIRAILRRTREQVEDDPIIRVADLEINEDSHDVTRAGQPVDLSPTEYKLLRYLMDNEGRVLSKAQILDHVWQYDWGGDAAIVESYISYLRKKVDGIEVDDGEGGKRKVTPLIETKRGIGYMIREPKN